MTGGAVLAMIVGVVIPAAVALVTRESLPPWVKEALLLLLSTATGVVTAVVTSPPTTLSGWEHLALNVLVAFVAAEASDLAQRKTGTVTAIHAATDRHFGLGRYDPTLQLPKAA